MGKFRRRIYHNWGQIWRDLKSPMKNRGVLRSGLVSYAFRERLMLTVTEVNGCRYCSYFHAQEALKAGLSEAETRSYLQGNLNHAPADELPALFYAQHWADRDGQPEKTLRQEFYKTYGSNKAEAIETVLHMIRMGNLLGNLGDYILYKISFGHLGLTKAEKIENASQK
jgi:AhpD family alkylhydroperoxidase